MELKKIPTWKINPAEFELDRVLLNLEVLENGPTTLQDYIKEE